MNRNTLNAIGTGVVSLAVFFVVGTLVGSHFATNHIERVLPRLSSHTVAVAQNLGSDPQPPTPPVQPVINGTPAPTADSASIANTERASGGSSNSSLTLFAPAPTSAHAPGTDSTTSVDGHHLFLAGGPALPIQDIAHFVDPCTIAASAAGCPHGVSGTVLLADTHPAPLMITHIESLEAAPTDDYQTCMVDDTAPIPAGDGRFAIASNNPATFTATDAGTDAMLGTTSTSSALRAQFDGEEAASETSHAGHVLHRSADHDHAGRADHRHRRSGNDSACRDRGGSGTAGRPASGQSHEHGLGRAWADGARPGAIGRSRDCGGGNHSGQP